MNPRIPLSNRSILSNFRAVKIFFCYLIFTFFAVSVSGEILVRIFLPFDPLAKNWDRTEEHPYIRTDWAPHYENQYRLNGLTGSTQTMGFKINAFGFRGSSMKTAEKPAGTTRLFFLGGSTTECLLLPEEKTFAALVEGKLSQAFPGKRFESINQGISGYLAADSLAVLLYKVLYYQPDTVVVMHGLNDMRYGLTTFYDPIRRRGYDKYLYRLNYREPLSASISGILKHSLFFTLIKWRIWNRFFPSESERFKTVSQDLQEKRLRRRRIPFTEPHPSKGLEDFLKNMREIIWVCRGHGVRLLLMTEPSIYTPSVQPAIESQLWMGLIQRIPPPINLPSPFLYKEMARFNDALRELAKEEGVELIDLEKNIPKTADSFYDDAHFKEAGAAKTAEVIAGYLISHPGPAKPLGPKTA